jgi:galactokinase
MTEAASALEARFGRGGTIVTARAPGRVNLIGEHTDYNEGFVLTTGTEGFVEVAVRRRKDRLVRLFAMDFEQDCAVQLGNSLEKRDPDWCSYVYGLFEEFRARSLLTTGFDLVVRGTIPSGAGLSSSAALETAAALALEDAFGFHMDPVESVKLCQEVEHRWAGVRCGIMDQMVSRFARPDHALLLDCRDLERRDVPLGLA